MVRKSSFIKVIGLVTAEETSDLPRRVVFFVLALFSILLWYIGLRYFIFAGPAYGADNSSHLAEIIKIAEQLRSLTFDFWFEQVNLGYPLFTAYNVLPYVLMATVVAVTESFLEPMIVYNSSIILFLSIIPSCWYYAARLMQLSRLVALIFSLLPIFLSDYTNFGLTIGSVMSMGLYTQLWAMPLFPIVIACYYRLLILKSPNGMLAVIVSHSLLFSIHTLLSLLAGGAGFLLLVVNRHAWQMIVRYLLTQISIVVLFSYWLVSYFPSRDFLVKLYATNHPFRGPDLSKFVDLFAGGKIFDSGYPQPVLTLFLVIGLLVCVRKINFLRAWSIYFLVIGLILFLWGAGDHLASRILPFIHEIPFRRYLPIIHFSSGLIIAWGISYCLMKTARLVKIITGINTATIAKDLVIVIAILLAIDRYSFAKSLLRTKIINDDFRQLSQLLSAEPDARFLVHSRFRTSSHFYRNLLPLMADRPQLTSYARGIRDTISFYYTDTFNFSRSSYELFNIRHLVSRVDIPPQNRPGFLLQRRLGDYRLYRAEGQFSNFAFIDSTFAITHFNERSAINYLRQYNDFYYDQRNMPILRRDPPIDRPYVSFTVDGKAQHFQTTDDLAVQIDGKQFYQQIFNTDHRPTGQLTEKGYQVLATTTVPRYLLFKVSYHPNWQVTVNGQQQQIELVAPNFMAVYLPAGDSEVSFSYRSPRLPQFLFLFTVAFWLFAFSVRKKSWAIFNK